MAHQGGGTGAGTTGGGGTGFNILDFFLISDVSILTVVPEPSSIENGYRFIKGGLYRRLRAACRREGTRRLVEAAVDPKNELGLRTPVDLMRRVEAEYPEEATVLRREMSAFRPRFVVNEVRDERDVAIGHQLVAACQRHLGLQHGERCRRRRRTRGRDGARDRSPSR